MKHKIQKEKAFIETVKQVSGTINSLCRVFCSSDHEVKDARQEILIQLWRSYDSFSGQSSLNTWTYRLSLNTLLKRDRNQNKIKYVELDHLLEKPNQLNGLYNDDDVQLLYNILDNLAPLDRAIMILYIEGYKYAEIGEMLNLSATNVSSKISRIKKKLSEVYKSMEI